MRVILLVEDNESDELLTIRALKRANVSNEIVVARDGQEALDYLFGTGPHQGRDVGDLPALVLLDLSLPKVDGLDVLCRIRGHQRTRRLPVVVLSSSDEEQDVGSSYDLGANAYVRKPVDFSQFAEAAKTLGLFWLLLKRAAASNHWRGMNMRVAAGTGALSSAMSASGRQCHEEIVG